jgi:hypothetical protein
VPARYQPLRMQSDLVIAFAERGEGRWRACRNADRATAPDDHRPRRPIKARCDQRLGTGITGQTKLATVSPMLARPTSTAASSSSSESMSPLPLASAAARAAW